MFFSTTSLAVLGMTSMASAHMIISSPVPYGKSSLTNSPLLADGSDFPCKQRTGVYDAEGASNVMPLGSTQELAFIGSAVHGGGSCQVSITYDEAPTKDSTWKVIHSIEGGCPMKGISGNNGNNADQVSPDTYSYTIPTTLPTGNATLAWTWFNKVGNREMYMNCAPVSLTSSSTKRSEDLVQRDQAAFSTLPDMFVANINNQCTTADSADLAFPAPGDSLEKDGAAIATPSPPVGAGCAAASAGSGTGSGSAATTAPAATSAAQIATSAVASKATSLPGGVFATIATSAKASATPIASEIPVASESPSPVVSESPSPAESEAPSSVASSATPASTGSTGSSGSVGAMTAGSACSPEGLWNCVGGSSFQQCGSGTWSVVQSLAAGTTCASGQNSAIAITASTKPKRAIRFSGEHVRRHLRRSS